MAFDLTTHSKFLSLLLRHSPSKLNLTMDKNGWVDIEQIIVNSSNSKTRFTREIIDTLVTTDNKQRYALNPEGTKIRANQGHSLKDVDVELKAKVPPRYLYHGTALSNVKDIKRDGLKKMNRQYVHLSNSEFTATTVGRRHGTPVVLTIDAEEMHKSGHIFYISQNNVWLTDNVPALYIK